MANVKISGMTAGTALTGTEAFESVQGGNTRQLSASQIKTYVDKATYTHNVPVTGFSITITNGTQYLILAPAGNLASGTITLPAGPLDGESLTISCTHNVSSLTLTPGAGQTIANTSASLNAGVGISFLYRSANATWYRTSS
jgi:hypothetical protein